VRKEREMQEKSRVVKNKAFVRSFESSMGHTEFERQVDYVAMRRRSNG
jgi:hypothetical protein